MNTTALLFTALALDVSFGELPNRLHPVAWIGRVIGAWKRIAPRPGLIAFLAGGVFAIGFPAFVAAGVFGLISTLSEIDSALGSALHFACYVFILQACFAWRALFQAGARLASALSQDDLGQARRELGGLCSRKADQLSAAEIEAATVESVAENSSDSFVAPLFWFGLLGLPGVVLYRVVNTQDAMLGYRGDLEMAGKVAAHLDDCMNWIPARITGLAVVMASAITKNNPGGAWRVMRRDHAQTESPNAGWPMAATAGALDTQLAKPGHYALGDADKVGSRPAGELIKRSLPLCQIAALIGGVLALAAGLAIAALPGALYAA